MGITSFERSCRRTSRTTTWRRRGQHQKVSLKPRVPIQAGASGPHNYCSQSGSKTATDLTRPARAQSAPSGRSHSGAVRRQPERPRAHSRARLAFSFFDSAKTRNAALGNWPISPQRPQPIKLLEVTRFNGTPPAVSFQATLTSSFHVRTS